MADSEQRAAVELRAASEGRRLIGTAIRYGELSAHAWGQERFAPGAFTNLDNGSIRFDVGHDRARTLARTGGAGLVLTDTPAALEFAVDLPETREAADALELVRTGVYRGASVRFVPLRARTVNQVRVVERAKLLAIAVVMDPAYKGSNVLARHQLEPAEINWWDF